jgi:hypothetical protein
MFIEIDEIELIVDELTKKSLVPGLNGAGELPS